VRTTGVIPTYSLFQAFRNGEEPTNQIANLFAAASNGNGKRPTTASTSSPSKRAAAVPASAVIDVLDSDDDDDEQARNARLHPPAPAFSPLLSIDGGVMLPEWGNPQDSVAPHLT
jgi:hypothetical protein